jgi:hypothetical protein
MCKWFLAYVWALNTITSSSSVSYDVGKFVWIHLIRIHHIILPEFFIYFSMSQKSKHLQSTGFILRLLLIIFSNVFVKLFKSMHHYFTLEM